MSEVYDRVIFARDPVAYQHLTKSILTGLILAIKKYEARIVEDIIHCKSLFLFIL